VVAPRHAKHFLQKSIFIKPLLSRNTTKVVEQFVRTHLLLQRCRRRCPNVQLGATRNGVCPLQTPGGSVCGMSHITRKVLVADDSPVVRDVIRTFLEERSDLTICGEAATGREAVEKTLALKPDLVVLDLSMPELNGAEAASVIKELFPGVRIIMFTMFSEDIGKSLTEAIGVDAVLSKPDGMARTGQDHRECVRLARSGNKIPLDRKLKVRR
jgi:CheY-like chemotaxis protein